MGLSLIFDRVRSSYIYINNQVAGNSHPILGPTTRFSTQIYCVLHERLHERSYKRPYKHFTKPSTRLYGSAKRGSMVRLLGALYNASAAQ